MGRAVSEQEIVSSFIFTGSQHTEKLSTKKKEKRPDRKEATAIIHDPTTFMTLP
jgi:hypothetical protein